MDPTPLCLASWAVAQGDVAEDIVLIGFMAIQTDRLGWQMGALAYLSHHLTLLEGLARSCSVLKQQGNSGPQA